MGSQKVVSLCALQNLEVHVYPYILKTVLELAENKERPQTIDAFTLGKLASS